MCCGVGFSVFGTGTREEEERRGRKKEEGEKEEKKKEVEQIGEKKRAWRRTGALM